LQHHATKPLTDAEIKAAKIREALEKMKEAKMKKIYIKFFLEDNLEKGMLIDERWTVAETMQKLANKLGILLTPEHAIVEEYPELHIRKCF
jgi:amyloid beta A4 precursor protein-binding family B protein 1-interacting protein